MLQGSSNGTPLAEHCVSNARRKGDRFASICTAVPIETTQQIAKNSRQFYLRRSCSPNQVSQWRRYVMQSNRSHFARGRNRSWSCNEPSIVALSQSMSIVVCYCLHNCLSSNSIGLKMNFQAITKNSFEKGIQRLLGLTIVAKVDRHSAKFKRIP